MGLTQIFKQESTGRADAVRYLGQLRSAEQAQVVDSLFEEQPHLITQEAVTPTAHLEHFARPLNCRVQKRDRITLFLQEQLISEFYNAVGGGNDFHLDVADESGTVTAVREDNPLLRLANLF